MTAPRSLRNNNPGNIEHVPSFRWFGELPPDPAIEPRFARFDTPANGFRALARNLLNYQRRYSLRTVREIVNRWAPPVENETTAYVAAVARALGVHPDQALDLEDPPTLTALSRAIANYESGGWAPFWREEDLAAGIAWALVLAAPVPPVVTLPKVEHATPAAGAPEAAAPEAEDRIPANPDPLRDFNAYNPLADTRPPMPFPIVPIVAALLPQIVAALPDLARILSRTPSTDGQKPSVSERNVQVLEKVGEIVTRSTGEPTVEGAVRKLQVDSAAREAAARAVRMSFPELVQLAELNERSTGQARAFAERMTATGPLWRAAGFGVILAVLAIAVVAGGGWMLREVLQADQTDLQTKGMIIGALIAAVTQVLGYFFGSSASSRSKDQALVDVVERR
jgi:hypothetical protein